MSAHNIYLPDVFSYLELCSVHNASQSAPRLICRYQVYQNTAGCFMQIVYFIDEMANSIFSEKKKRSELSATI